MRVKNIFFDFDGVIAESVQVKTEAFCRMYLEFGKKIAEKVVEHHESHGGMSRFEKFKRYHKEFLNIDLDENQIKELADTFSSLVKRRVVEAPEVEGVRSFLEQHYRTMKFWVISGTPTNEIRDIVKQKGMGHFFIHSYGSPNLKNHWVEKLMKQHQLRERESVFVGDAKSDYKAALDNGIQFILRETPEGHSVFKAIDVPRFTAFPEFQAILEEI
ncbi:MAG: HAD family hydrolase [bacterium]|nr:HAD family hydrolase [bacterium]